MKLLSTLLLVLVVPTLTLAGDSIDNNGKCPVNLPVGADCPLANLIALHQDEVINKGDGIDNNRDDRCRRQPNREECRPVAYKKVAYGIDESSGKLQFLNVSCLSSGDAAQALDWANQVAINSSSVTTVAASPKRWSADHAFTQVECPDLQKICQDRTADKACLALQSTNGNIQFSLSQDYLRNLVSENLVSFNPAQADLNLDIQLGNEHFKKINFCYGQAHNGSYLVGCNVELNSGLSLNMSAIVE